MKGDVTDINQLDSNEIYSYADYVLWKFKERVELIKGKIFKMSPAPNIAHQVASGNLFAVFFNALKNDNTTCKLFSAPFDVALLNKNKSTDENKIYTIVQPDLCIVCDSEKLADGKKCMGAPDLVVEILSPGNTYKEINLKFDLYEEAEVQEYWIVYPEERMVQIFVLQDGKYIGIKPVAEPGTIKSTIFPSVEVDLSEVFN